MRTAAIPVAAFVAGFVIVACRQQAPEPPPPAAATTSAAYCLPSAGAAAAPKTLQEWAQGAVLFDDLGSFHRTVTTTSAPAQQYFDQGMRLLWGFNHDEATRAFAKATELDPSCASCYWGAALALGPNYNVPMLPDRAQVAWDALGKAKALAPKATPVEQALIAALAQRYQGPAPLDPAAAQPYVEAYAAAMGEVARQFRDDNDVQVMWAEALMTANPWKLWSLDGKPAPSTPTIVGALEGVLAKDAQHPGANHYYIHAVEASRTPARAVPSADRLAGLMRGAGHIVHMPAHIFQRVGRYADAEAANRDGAAIDVAYMKKVSPQGYYGMYLAHNYDFESFSASMRGRSQQAIAAQRKNIEAMPTSLVDAMPGMDFFVAKLYLAQLRFGRWDEVLAEPAPPEQYPVWTGMYRFAQAYALAAKGQVEAAVKAQADFDLYVGRLPADLGAGYNSAQDVFAIGTRLLSARLLQAQGKPAEALAPLREAVQREDQLAYDEPADWFFPARHLLGAALLKLGRAREAERVYLDDLQRHPENGWALQGLVQARRAQGKDAGDAERRFALAWKDADVAITASAF